MASTYSTASGWVTDPCVSPDLARRHLLSVILPAWFTVATVSCAQCHEDWTTSVERTSDTAEDILLRHNPDAAFVFAHVRHV